MRVLRTWTEHLEKKKAFQHQLRPIGVHAAGNLPLHTHTCVTLPCFQRPYLSSRPNTLDSLQSLCYLKCSLSVPTLSITIPPRALGNWLSFCHSNKRSCGQLKVRSWMAPALSHSWDWHPFQHDHFFLFPWLPLIYRIKWLPSSITLLASFLKGQIQTKVTPKPCVLIP